MTFMSAYRRMVVPSKYPTCTTKIQSAPQVPQGLQKFVDTEWPHVYFQICYSRTLGARLITMPNESPRSAKWRGPCHQRLPQTRMNSTWIDFSIDFSIYDLHTMMHGTKKTEKTYFKFITSKMTCSNVHAQEIWLNWSTRLRLYNIIVSTTMDIL